jgi:hypothetical protein
MDRKPIGATGLLFLEGVTNLRIYMDTRHDGHFAKVHERCAGASYCASADWQTF